MVDVNQIKWGGYKNWEGPYFIGSIKFKVSNDPDFLEKCVAVVTSTEGGALDAYNGYDSCISSIGLIQWCERLFLSSRMLGSCVSYDISNFDIINSYLASLPVPAELKKNSANKWRYHIKSGEVSSEMKLREMFFGGVTGVKGTWDKDHINFAKEVAAKLSSMWENNQMVKGQIEFAKKNVTNYMTVNTQRCMTSLSDNGYDGALRAMVASYSANNPDNAEKCLMRAMGTDKIIIDSEKMYEKIAREMAINSGIGIWPERYKKISIVIDSLFGVKTPTLEYLRGSIKALDKIDTVKELQEFLIKEGYDIGPAGADGIMGHKTKSALSDFQSQMGLSPDGIPGPKTYAKINEIQESRDESLSFPRKSALIPISSKYSLIACSNSLQRVLKTVSLESTLTGECRFIKSLRILFMVTYLALFNTLIGSR